MEKWKIAVIALLLGVLGGYGFMQNRSPSAAQDATNGANGAMPTPVPTAVVAKFIGQTLPSWDFPASQWANTPKPIAPADLQGHVTLVEFWRSECPHCQEAAPFLEKLNEKYKSRGFQIVSFQSPGMADDPGNPENDWTKVQGKMQELGIKYPVAFDKGGTFFKTQLGGTTYPTLFVLDKQGIVRYANTGYTTLNEPGRAKIKAMLKTIESLLKK